jgi:3-phosphoshikimate 1-carboxyvinyltransferase
MIKVSKKNRDCTGEIRLPASKSISNRLLILQFSYGSELKIKNLSRSDDTVLLSSLLDLIRQYQLKGETGLLRVDTRNAGTVMRFLLALLSLTRGHYLLIGNGRMHERPVGALVDALRDYGADIEYLDEPGYAPLLVRGRTISGSRINLDASISSQFLTALLLTAPKLPEGLTLELTGIPVSWPYVKMTTGILTELGIQVIVQENSIRVYNKPHIRAEIEVEPDWSAASFWYCMLSMADKGSIYFPGLHKSGRQGDQQVATFFRQLGVDTFEEKNGIRIRKAKHMSTNFQADFTGYPDLALPVILACAAAGTAGRFTGLEQLRIKESDRIESLTAGLMKAGIYLREDPQGSWNLAGKLSEPSELHISDYEDHRIAMTFACLAMKGFTVNFEHPEVVNKSYPGFWKDLESVGFTCTF